MTTVNGQLPSKSTAVDAGWSNHPQWPLDEWVTYVTMFLTYPVVTGGWWRPNCIEMLVIWKVMIRITMCNKGGGHIQFYALLRKEIAISWGISELMGMTSAFGLF